MGLLRKGREERSCPLKGITRGRGREEDFFTVLGACFSMWATSFSRLEKPWSQRRQWKWDFFLSLQNGRVHT